MSVTITDPEILAKLLAGQSMDLKDAAGNVVGRVRAESLGKLPPGVRSPLSDDELAARMKEPAVGRPLADIMRDLQARG